MAVSGVPSVDQYRQMRESRLRRVSPTEQRVAALTSPAKDVKAAIFSCPAAFDTLI